MLSDGQWICGLSIKAISRRVGVRIVVVRFGPDADQLPPAAIKGNVVKKPVVLKLHYQLLVPRPGFEFPPEWQNCRDEGELFNHERKGAGLQRAWSVATPKSSTKTKQTQSRAWTKATPSVRTSAASVSCPQDSCSFRTCANHQGLAAQPKGGNRGDNKRPSPGLGGLVSCVASLCWYNLRGTQKCQ